jgi:hypothetical protein
MFVLIPKSEPSVAGFLVGDLCSWQQDVLQDVKCWVPLTLVVVVVVAFAQDPVDVSAWIFHMLCFLCAEMLHG